MVSASSSIEGNGDISPRISIDSVNLNDDLAVDAGSEISSSSVSVIHNSNHNNSNSNKRKSGSVVSFRNSIDADSSFSSSAYFFANSPHNVRQQQQQSQLSNRDQSLKYQLHQQQQQQYHAQQLQNRQLDSLSPLGPNSIYKLTVASDLSRKQKNRSPKNHVTINGGLTTVYNLHSPTVAAIPQIQLSSLKTRVSNEDLKQKYVDGGLESEFKKFDSQESKLTEGTLQKLQQQQLHESGKGNDNENNIERVTEIQDQNDYSDYKVSSSIPPIFSDPSFRLDDPRTFKKVIENSKIISTNDDDAGLNPSDYLVNNTQLQEKLSHYLDLVEISLVEEISKSSNSFFNTIDEIQEIENQSGLCMSQFNSITSQLESIETEECMKGLNILNKIKLRKNVDQLENSLLQIQQILGLFEICQALFQESKYTACLESIVELEILINDNGMLKLPALYDLQNDLHKLKVNCTNQYIKDFINQLVNDLHSHYQSIPVQDSLSRMSGKKSVVTTTGINKFQAVDEETKNVLREYVSNLASLGMLGQAYSAYQERIVNEVKEIIKVNLPRRDSGTPSRSNSVPPPQDLQPEAKKSPEPPTGNTLMVPSSSNNGSATLSTNLKSMSSTEFLEMLTRTFTNLSECLRRLTTHQKILLDLALTSIPPSENIDVMTFDITLSINKAIEITQIRLAKVINVRSELIADLPVEQYLRFYSISSAYLQECELINPGFIASEGGNSLNDWLRNHINYFIHRLHSNSLKSLIQECDKEVWKEVTSEEILKNCQSIVNELVTYAEFVESKGKSGYSGDQWTKAMDLQKDMDEIKQEHDSIVARIHISPDSRLRIGHKQFLIPSFMFKSLRSVKDYIILSKIFPSRTSTIENDLLNYFKLLNSRTSQAILGAGATRTAGLKHIFPKHMALCIQLIGFNTELLESIQIIFKNENNGNANNSTNGQQGGANNASDDLNFTRIISNYKDHENELFGKLISMMYERTLNHCNTIKTIDWSEPIKSPHQCHQYMETLVKDTTTITKVLLKYLPEIQCQLILSQVFDNYKKLFVECYCTQIPQFKDFNEKHSLLRDIDYFRVKLGEIPGYGNSGQVIWENINSMPTIEDAKMEEVMRKNIERERGIEERKSLENARKSVEAENNSKDEDHKVASKNEGDNGSDEVLFDISKATSDDNYENGTSQVTSVLSQIEDIGSKISKNEEESLPIEPEVVVTPMESQVDENENNNKMSVNEGQSLPIELEASESVNGDPDTKTKSTLNNHEIDQDALTEDFLGESPSENGNNGAATESNEGNEDSKGEDATIPEIVEQNVEIKEEAASIDEPKEDNTKVNEDEASELKLKEPKNCQVEEEEKEEEVADLKVNNLEDKTKEEDSKDEEANVEEVNVEVARAKEPRIEQRSIEEDASEGPKEAETKPVVHDEETKEDGINPVAKIEETKENETNSVAKVEETKEDETEEVVPMVDETNDEGANKVEESNEEEKKAEGEVTEAGEAKNEATSKKNAKKKKKSKKKK
ncbi:hypothetical protein CLIB1423_27S00628 [[Candida] railenensis]|uniref:Vacuolar protein sorting-associated protein 54 C-terminal domain-containing protein n=1 Tax=[Candida] railenensis TaxID=45579 RepID=A0A9P0QTQ7_9ASCO|nr:hypothetical protein CLIB1423_27S00628 [[Candida] railenensis]